MEQRLLYRRDRQEITEALRAAGQGAGAKHGLLNGEWLAVCGDQKHLRSLKQRPCRRQVAVGMDLVQLHLRMTRTDS